MYRALIICFCLFFAHSSYAAIYKWVNEQGNTHYGQRPPRDKNIDVKKVFVKSSGIIDSEKDPTSIQDSANEIAKSNADHKAANDKIQQQANEKRRLQERCETSKKNLAELDYGGNRLYKDADGNYSRLSPDDKTKKREELNTFINENCR